MSEHVRFVLFLEVCVVCFTLSDYNITTAFTFNSGSPELLSFNRNYISLQMVCSFCTLIGVFYLVFHMLCVNIQSQLCVLCDLTIISSDYTIALYCNSCGFKSFDLNACYITLTTAQYQNPTFAFAI